MTTPQTLADVPATTVDALLDRYDVFLLDAFGVLLSTDEALPGAVEFMTRLEDAGKDWLIVTNDASKSARSSAARYCEKGLDVAESEVLTSGSMVPWWFDVMDQASSSPRCLVLGPEESRQMVVDGGGVLIDADEYGTLDVLVVADDWGYPLLEGLDAAISMVFNTVEAGRRPHLVLPNPDLIYPKGEGRFGITAGSVALVIDAAIQLRFPNEKLEFVKLGKPHRPIFEMAWQRTGRPDRTRMVMLGDQLWTDVRGARSADIDAVILGTGVTSLRDDLALEGDVPNWKLASLVADG